jgi:hypothetical protein
MNISLVRAVEALRKYGQHQGAGTDGGCCMWDDNCWCGYGVELQQLEQTAGMAVSRPVQDAQHG